MHRYAIAFYVQSYKALYVSHTFSLPLQRGLPLLPARFQLASSLFYHATDIPIYHDTISHFPYTGVLIFEKWSESDTSSTAEDIALRRYTMYF
ncbi:MAG: hypothetical protein PVS3B1_37810 [Ktedonobacteraceae bacterium]